MSGGNPYWDNMAHRYDALYQNDWSMFENSILKGDLERLLGHSPGKRVLDIGCGTGLAYELLGGATSAIDYVGLDNSAVMLDEFGKRYPGVKTIQASGDSIESIPPHQFDLVISVNVAASFPVNTRRLLYNIFNALVPGGLFYLSFLNRFSLRRLLRLKLRSPERYRSRGDNNSKDFVLAKVYSGNQLRSMCLSVGFSSVDCLYHSVLGGVWESSVSVRLETTLVKIAPWLGHSIIVSGMRNGNSAGEK